MARHCNAAEVPKRRIALALGEARGVRLRSVHGAQTDASLGVTPYPFASKLACYKGRPVGSLGAHETATPTEFFLGNNFFSNRLPVSYSNKKGEER